MTTLLRNSGRCTRPLYRSRAGGRHECGITLDGLTKRYGPVTAVDQLTFEVEPGRYFMLGDNRDWSKDSREWGTVRRAEIKGPAFLLCQTYRFLGHHVGDISRAYYRTKDEELRYKAERDPLHILTRWLVAERLAAPEEFARVEQQVRAEIAAGLQFALAAPYPDPGEVDRDVYA